MKLDSTIKEEKLRHNRVKENLEIYIKTNSIKDIKCITKDDLNEIILNGKHKLVGESRTGLYLSLIHILIKVTLSMEIEFTTTKVEIAQ